MIRKLNANEIECRPQIIKQTGCSLLLYKDARVDMKILDETFGNNNWQRTHELIGGNLYCTVSIWDPEKKQWISKQDVGVESYSQAEKGQASDSFKRACFNLGIGRELYTAPFIWIVLMPDEIYQTKDEVKLKPGVKFYVKEIRYNEAGEITALQIVDAKGMVRYSKDDIKPPEAKKQGLEKSNPVPRPNTLATNKETTKLKLECVECGKEITSGVATYSSKNFGKEICLDCQARVK